MKAWIAAKVSVIATTTASVTGKVLMYAGADLLFMAGLGIMSYGFWMAWAPLGPIVFGAMICIPMALHKLRGNITSA